MKNLTHPPPPVSATDKVWVGIAAQRRADRHCGRGGGGAGFTEAKLHWGRGSREGGRNFLSTQNPTPKVPGA